MDRPTGPTLCLTCVMEIRRSARTEHLYRLDVTSEETIHAQIAQSLKEHPAKKGVRFNVVVTIVEIGGALAMFHLARRAGAATW